MLVVGTVTVSDAGTWAAASGSLAEALMTGEVAMLDAVPSVFPDFPDIPTDKRADALRILAAKVNAQAPLLGTLLGGLSVRVAAGSLDVGVPSVERVLSGAVE